MKYKLSESKILQKIKDNKFKISLISGTLAAVLGISLGLGYAYNINAGNNTFGSGNPGGNAGGLPDGYVPEINVVPGEIKFDPNGKLLIPELVDKENPEGNYEYEIENNLVMDSSIKEAISQEPEFNEDLDLKYQDLVSKETNIFSEQDMSIIIKTPSEFESFINYYLPDNSIDFTSEMEFGQLFDNIKNNSLNHTKENSINKEESSNLLALNGINFDKEYDKLMRTIAIEEETTNYPGISVRGGGGITPGIPGGGANLPSIPDIPTDNVDKQEAVTIAEIKEIYDRDYRTRVQFEVIYGALLIAISLASLVLAIVTFGASIASAVIDLVFCSLAMITSVLECAVMRSNFVLPIKSLEQTLEENIDQGAKPFLWSWIYDKTDFIASKYIGGSNGWTKFKDSLFRWGESFKLNHGEITKLLIKNAKLLKVSLSILSFALTVLKEQLYAYVYLPMRYILDPLYNSKY